MEASVVLMGSGVFVRQSMLGVESVEFGVESGKKVGGPRGRRGEVLN